MKIIGINGSPRAKGNTRLALDTMGEVFAQEGVEFDILHIGHKLSTAPAASAAPKPTPAPSRTTA